jgi:hypothetical protein
MPRARLIKPDFFFDEELAELPSDAQLLFVALWMAADREGRLEDKPRVIKAKIFPFGRGDVPELLKMLADSDFILRYQIEGKRYIQIRSFLKHQKPHSREADSTIPAPPGQCIGSARAMPGHDLGSAKAMPSRAERESETESVSKAEAERERGRHDLGSARVEAGDEALSLSLNFSPFLAGLVEELAATGLYLPEMVPRVARKQRVYLGRDPTRKELLGWLNREQEPKAKGQGNGRTEKAKVERVVKNISANRHLNPPKGRST